MPADLLIYGGAAIIIVSNVIAAFLHNDTAERRIYWASWLIGVSTMALSATDRGWRTVAGGIVAGLLLAIFIAYARTPYLMIRGRVYSYRYSQRVPRPTDYDNRVSAAKAWWTLAVLTVCGAVALHVSGVVGSTLGIGALITVALGAVGHIDRRTGFPVARGQYVPFAIVCLASIPALLIPLAGYLIGYYWLTGKPVEDDDATD